MFSFRFLFYAYIPTGSSLQLNGFSKTQAVSASANLSVRSVILDFKQFDDTIMSNVTNFNSVEYKTKRSPGNDIVSRNITMVLENLLKNYERTQLPTHGKGNL